VSNLRARLGSFGGWSTFSLAARRFLWGSAWMGIAWAIPWTLLPLYLHRRGYGEEEIGQVVSCDALGKLCVALPAAFLLARSATRPVLIATSLAAGAAYALLPWMPNLGLLMACNLVAGLSFSVHFVAVAPFLFRHSQGAERASLFALSEAVHTGAAVLGAWGGGRVVEALVRQSGDERRALAWALTLGGVAALCSLFSYARLAERAIEVGERATRPLAVFWRERVLLARFAVPQFLISGGAGLVIPFLGLYFQERFGVAPAGVADLNAVGWLLMTLGYLVTPFVTRRLGFVAGAVVLELASVPFFLLLAFTQHYALAVTGFFVRGVLMNAATPVIKNFSMRSNSPDARSLQNGVTMLVGGLGWVVGPRLGGWLLEQSPDNYRVLMCTTVGFYVAAAAATWWLLRPLERAASLAPVDGARPR